MGRSGSADRAFIYCLLWVECMVQCVAPVVCQGLTAGNGLQALTASGVHCLLVQVKALPGSESECTPSSIFALVTMSHGF